MRSLGNTLITGGASGLGAATARAVEAAGGKPIVLDRQHPGTDLPFEQVDLAHREDVEVAVQRVVEKHGRIDAVVNAAGIDACGKLQDVSAEDWERVVRVNLLGTVAVTRAALPHLRDSGGTVVNCASTLGLRALSDATAYCASKFGVVGFSRALAAELAGEVGVTTLIPGGMSTSFFDGRPEQYKPGADAKLNDPEHVAAAVVFALSQPRGCEVREMVVCPSEETSWP
ncbi:SDR family oxidoreductase [Nocardiopsis algeriensis]|uniref:NAD(P)-dependent dehydrogenase (Short-subunit alcohol dehydrogenase family) n=1 Tax=Nocardiopsis algeriensis TaxID=1478215 RepID=A0A841IX93_9ACTN|nr:SDR family oxidoreductase [Nocardiopsis algeriensis]MBB6121896.1 NAD(P)-dependent dehydrogenase (short-subunit alcohol dehydrogenase family) [Nocardiopsis algeriensis]